MLGPDTQKVTGSIADKGDGTGPVLSAVPTAHEETKLNTDATAASKPHPDSDEIRGRLRFTFAVKDGKSDYPIALNDGVMPSGMDLMKLWSGCYEDLPARRPEFDGVESEISLDVSLVNDREQGWVTTDTHDAADIDDTFDEVFRECIAESSFAFAMDGKHEETSRASVRATMSVKTSSSVSEQDIEAFTLCVEKLKAKNPSAAAAFAEGKYFRDEEFSECMSDAMGLPSLSGVPTGSAEDTGISDDMARPCLKDLKSRKPHTYQQYKDGKSIDDTLFAACIENLAANQ